MLSGSGTLLQPPGQSQTKSAACTQPWGTALGSVEAGQQPARPGEKGGSALHIPHLAMNHEPSLPSCQSSEPGGCSSPHQSTGGTTHGRAARGLLQSCQLLVCWGSSCPHTQPRPAPLAPLPPSAAPRCRGSPNQQAGMGCLPPVPPAPAEPLPIPLGCTDPGHMAPDALGASSQGSRSSAVLHRRGAYHGARPAGKVKGEGPRQQELSPLAPAPPRALTPCWLRGSAAWQ